MSDPAGRRPDTLALRWPPRAPLPEVRPLDPTVTLSVAVDAPAFCRVQAAIGFSVSDDAWAELQRSLCDDAMVFAWVDATPVAVAAAQQRAHGVELGWVAVDPAHRGRGLGHAVCARLVHALLSSGHTGLFGSTQDHRLAALHIYRTLGFVPVVEPHTTDRWRAVCHALGAPWAPEAWARVLSPQRP